MFIQDINGFCRPSMTPATNRGIYMYLLRTFIVDLKETREDVYLEY